MAMLAAAAHLGHGVVDGINKDRAPNLIKVLINTDRQKPGSFQNIQWFGHRVLLNEEILNVGLAVYQKRYIDELIERQKRMIFVFIGQ